MHSCDTPKTVLPAPQSSQNPPLCDAKRRSMQEIHRAQHINISSHPHPPPLHTPTCRQKDVFRPQISGFPSQHTGNQPHTSLQRAFPSVSPPCHLRVPSVSGPTKDGQKTEKTGSGQGGISAPLRCIAYDTIDTSERPQCLPPIPAACQFAGSPAATFILPVLK